MRENVREKGRESARGMTREFWAGERSTKYGLR